MTPAEYFIAHSLKEDFVKSLGWTWDEHKITIPVHDAEGNLLYNKYRHLDGRDNKFSFDAGSHPSLYGIERLKDEKVVYSEGEVDTARLWQEGIHAVTGTAGANTFNEEFALPLKEKTVYICLDTDKAGQEAIPKYVEILEKIGASPLVVSLPLEYKDISEYFTAGHTKEEFQVLIDNAVVFKNTLLDKFKTETGTELMDADIPPEEWLIERILPANGITFIVGAEATGKSFYTLSLANSIITGEKWLGQFEVKKQTKVLFIDKENTRYRTKTRIRGLGITSETAKDMSWIRYPQEFEFASEKGGISDFAQHLSQKVTDENIGLIIIDSFIDLMTGEENSSGDTREFFAAVRQLFPDRAILVLHHENKPSQGYARTASQRVRGSTNIMAQTICAFSSAAIPKTINEFVLTQIKAGDSEKLKPFKVELVTRPAYWDTTKTIVADIKYNGEYCDEEKKGEEARDLIIECVTEGISVSRQDITQFCLTNGVSGKTTSRVLTELFEDKTLTKDWVQGKKHYMLK